jgi:hypothetical protein
MDEMLYVIQLAIQMYHDNNVNEALFNVTTNGFFIKQWPKLWSTQTVLFMDDISTHTCKLNFSKTNNHMDETMIMDQID